MTHPLLPAAIALAFILTIVTTIWLIISENPTIGVLAIASAVVLIVLVLQGLK